MDINNDRLFDPCPTKDMKLHGFTYQHTDNIQIIEVVKKLTTITRWICVCISNDTEIYIIRSENVFNQGILT